MQPKRILDLFCGAGGAAMGLHKMWPDADILGIDIKPQPRYPFRFRQADAMQWLDGVLRGFDFIWASPPCQHYTQMLNHGLTDRGKHPDLIPEVRHNLHNSRIPYVIENVAGSPLKTPGMLCGEMFGLLVMRHRFFECSFHAAWPEHPAHVGYARRKQGDGGYYYRVYGHETGKASWGKAMGISWMKSYELAQAIPPAFSHYVAHQAQSSI